MLSSRLCVSLVFLASLTHSFRLDMGSLNNPLILATHPARIPPVGTLSQATRSKARSRCNFHVLRLLMSSVCFDSRTGLLSCHSYRPISVDNRCYVAHWISSCERVRPSTRITAARRLICQLSTKLLDNDRVKRESFMENGNLKIGNSTNSTWSFSDEAWEIKELT